MITEDYVSFETAKLLKEKGFNEICEMFYCKPHEGYMRNTKRNEWWNSDLREDMSCTCPTLQMAMKWLREEKKIGIEVNIIFDLDDDNKWYYEYGFCILQLSGTYKKFAECDYDGYKTYEESCEAAIKYCLENLI